MIIIAILMAVAIPTFLAQKSNARRTKVMSDFKTFQHAMEACSAAKNPFDGTYGGCSEHVQLVAYDKGLKNIKLCCSFHPTRDGVYDINGVSSPGARVSNITAPGDDIVGYEFDAWIRDGDTMVMFQLIHWPDGTVTRRCGKTQYHLPLSKDPLSGVPGSRICTNGSW